MIKYLIAILICLWASGAWGETLYVRPFGYYSSGAIVQNDYGDEDGSDYDNAFDGLTDIVWGDGVGKVGPGDTLYVCGEHPVYSNIIMDVTDSGASGNRITIRGDCPGDPGSIDGRTTMPSWTTEGNWTQDGEADRWYIDSSGWTYKDPHRVWYTKAGGSGLTEGQRVSAAASVDAEYEFYHDDTGGSEKVYVYATSNPSSYFEDIRVLGWMCNILISDESYIDVRDIDLYGGITSIDIMRSTYNKIYNCNIYDAYTGILIIGKTTPDYNVDSTHNEIYDNLIDGNWSLDNTAAIDYKNGPYVGIDIREGTFANKVYENIIKDFGKTCIRLGSTETGKWTTGAMWNEVYYNDISNPNMVYGKPFEVYGHDQLCCGNLIRWNNFHDHPTRGQLGGQSNIIAYNIFRDFMAHPLGERELKADTQQGFSQNAWIYEGAELTTDHIAVFNNTFYNLEEAAWRIHNSNTNGEPETTHHNYYINNFVYNAGTNAESIAYGFEIENDTDVNYTTVKNNIIYNSTRGAAAEFYYRGTGYTATNFNAADAQNDTISGNAQTDSSSAFYNPSNDNLGQKPASPGVSFGLTLSNNETEKHTEANAAADDDGEADGTTGWVQDTMDTLESQAVTYKVGSYALHMVSGDEDDHCDYHTTVTSGVILKITFWIYSTGGTGDDEDILFEIGTSQGDSTYESKTFANNDVWVPKAYVIYTTDTNLYLTFTEDGDDFDGEFYIDDLSIKSVSDDMLAPRSVFSNTTPSSIAVYTTDADDIIPGGTGCPIGAYAPADYLFTTNCEFSITTAEFIDWDNDDYTPTRNGELFRGGSSSASVSADINDYPYRSPPTIGPEELHGLKARRGFSIEVW